MFVSLKGKTRKGKNRIAEWGEKWIVLGGVLDCRACNLQPALDIISEREANGIIAGLRDGGNQLSRRWLQWDNDPDFEICVKNTKKGMKDE